MPFLGEGDTGVMLAVCDAVSRIRVGVIDEDEERGLVNVLLIHAHRQEVVPHLKIWELDVMIEGEWRKA